MQNFLKHTAKAAIVCSIALTAATAFAWTGPTAAPPNNNAAAPVNVGSTAQTKTGSLTVPILYDSNTANGTYYVQPSQTSILNKITTNSIQAPVYYDKNNNSYYVQPSQTSLFNVAEANTYSDKSNTAYYLVPSGTSNLSVLDLWDMHFGGAIYSAGGAVYGNNGDIYMPWEGQWLSVMLQGNGGSCYRYGSTSSLHGTAVSLNCTDCGPGYVMANWDWTYISTDSYDSWQAFCIRI